MDGTDDKNDDTENTFTEGKHRYPNSRKIKGMYLVTVNVSKDGEYIGKDIGTIRLNEVGFYAGRNLALLHYFSKILAYQGYKKMKYLTANCTEQQFSKYTILHITSHGDSKPSFYDRGVGEYTPTQIIQYSKNNPTPSGKRRLLRFVQLDACSQSYKLLKDWKNAFKTRNIIGWKNGSLGEDWGGVNALQVSNYNSYFYKKAVQGFSIYESHKYAESKMSNILKYFLGSPIHIGTSSEKLIK